MERMERSEIGKRLREIRKENHLTIKTVAAMLDISDEYWGRVERGKEMPSLKTIVAFANLFQVSSDYILYGIQSESEKTELDKSGIAALANFTQYDLNVIENIFQVYYQNEKRRKPENEGFSQILFAERLRNYREQANLTLEQLAQKAGINRNHLSQIELGNLLPTLNTLDKIVSALKIPIDSILADCIYAGRTVTIKNILNMYHQFTPRQKDFAEKLIKVYAQE